MKSKLYTISEIMTIGEVSQKYNINQSTLKMKLKDKQVCNHLIELGYIKKHKPIHNKNASWLFTKDAIDYLFTNKEVRGERPL